MYISPKLKSFPALLLGGGQENGYRSGTEGTHAIMGFSAACAAAKETMAQDIAKEKQLLEQLIAGVEKLPSVVINGCHAAPHILSLSIPGVPTQNTINILQESGICVSAGSACAKGHRSHTLTAMGLSPEVMDSSFRISLCRDTTEADIDAALQGIQNVITRMKR